MTPSQVITSARQFHNAVGDDFWSDAELYTYLDNASLRLILEANVIENRWDTVTVTDQQEYEKPSRSHIIKRITVDGRKVEPIDFRELDILNKNGSSAVTGTPQYYYWFDNVIGLHPIPSTAGLTIRTFSYDFQSPQGSTTTLSIPEQYHAALIFGVRAQMSAKELGHPNTSFYDQKWEEAVQQVVRAEMKRRRGDKFRRVLREEDLQQNSLGYI